MQKPKVYFKTFGCRTNLFDTQVMINSLKDFHKTNYEEDSDIVVVNSCTVTNGADSGVRNYINRLQNEGKKIYFTGCGVDTQGKNLFDKGLVFGVFGHSLKESINDLLKKQHNFFFKGDNESLDSNIVSDFSGKSRAFIKIQEGCNFACSYCIIPQVRGKARSFELTKIIEQIKILCDNGFSEFVLTGTNMGSWGIDKNEKLSQLIESICDIDEVKRLRLGSLEPSQIDSSFLSALQNQKIERHLHIALQHTSPTMLKIMNRQNIFKNDLELFTKLQKMGFALGSDYIVGHPGESEEIWNEAMTNFKLLNLTHIHSFIYSKRDGTRSSTLKDTINGNISKERKKQIEEIVNQNNYNFRKDIQTLKKPLKVLIETSKENGDSYISHGFDEYYNKIEITSKNKLDKWITINDFVAKNEGNYAEI
ncbi:MULTISPECIES: tRNA (N(6)-L-threonylcarbamoyladenosine(37)-C(2))-methylthiotransferase MtaB [Helicobacter]|uniref:tRNA (N(6)-L-threonylcarbamoyladenosine(37)-C(2))-methylthiotransferase MtaB n=1 Tax=Helicobacter ibis TaxID=2962633 RepID=A0ABT4VCP5_9HELI|nr:MULTISPECIES: tRNA (N(6)-L-threonylcarbamoyladenosine(37)-C(2))-methylthiotransferase MtaB [Helicobacter]MDA3966743.1 tRNA (N(6)-L-threonylcarbamoyladenosine(37)-C(2))-methylthiotransferase MtaB [Helicobacter sp. WB40]MDA3968475.1 tRNA (N(6)-L-threonylcarbamoyladenosine(37)-C(2))-methylthiotransferase MtaB [Helicobacter ibis]